MENISSGETSVRDSTRKVAKLPPEAVMRLGRQMASRAPNCRPRKGIVLPRFEAGEHHGGAGPEMTGGERSKILDFETRE